MKKQLKIVSIILMIVLLVTSNPTLSGILTEQVTGIINSFTAQASTFVIGRSGTIGTRQATDRQSGIVTEAFRNPPIRISLWRNPAAELEDTRGLEIIFNRTSVGFPPNLQGSLIFIEPIVRTQLLDQNRNGILNDPVPISLGRANTSNKTIDYTSDANFANNLITLDGTFVNDALGVYYRDMRSLTLNTFTTNWRTRMTRRTMALAAWNYILEGVPVGGDNRQYRVHQRINEIFNRGNLNYNNVAAWTIAQSESAYMQYLDLLMTLWTVSSGRQQQIWGQAIDDLIQRENLIESPISIVIDACALIGFNQRSYMIFLPVLDYLQFTAGIEHQFALDQEPWWSNTTLNRLFDGDTYRMLLRSIQESVRISPNFPRISERYDENDGFSHSSAAFTRGVFRTTRGTASTATGFFEFPFRVANTDYLDMFIFHNPVVTPPSFSEHTNPLGTTTPGQMFGYLLIPAPQPPRTVSLRISLRAEPDNYVIQSPTLGRRVQLTVASAVPRAALGTWEQIILNTQRANRRFNVRFTFTRTAVGATGSIMLPTNPVNVVWTPSQLREFVYGRSTFVTSDAVEGVQTAGQTNIRFNYTVVMRVEETGTVWENTATDSASFVILQPRIGFTSRPEAYSELKNFGVGSNMTGTLVENWEAMAGVPSTEQLYFAAGGSEFIVDITVEHVNDEVARRTYLSTFTGTNCEFMAGDTAGTFNFPSPGGGGSGNTSWNAHTGGSFTVTWTGPIPNLGVAVTALHSATSVAVPCRIQYNAALAAANAYVSAVNATTFQHTAASDGRTRVRTGWGASITTNSPVDPVSVTVTVPCSFRPATGDPPTGGVPCGNEMATASPGPAGSFTISVTWTIAPHIICGPCCSHVLPAINDTWAQTWTYDSTRITGVHVWTIDQAAVNGLQEIISANIVGAEIVAGRPNIFFNIANRNDAQFTVQDGRGQATGTSRAGRVRYSLLPAQHDEVTFNNGTRTNRCDGLATTFPGNVSPNGGGGHSQPYAHGFLYNAFRPGSSTTGATGPAGQLNYPTNTVGFLTTNTSARDRLTQEYNTFRNQRNTLVTPTMITDFLILQTSSGDQSVLYFHRPAPSAVTSETLIPRLDIPIADMWDNNINSASDWDQEHINIGSYNSRFTTPSQKFNWTSSGSSPVTFFEPDPAGTIVKPPRPSSRLMLYEGELNIIAQNINRSYVTGVAEVFWRNTLHWVDTASSRFAGVTNPLLAAPFPTNITTGITGFNFRTQGFTLDAPYSDEHVKINDIIIHSPVSTETVAVVSLPEARDQRIGGMLGGAADVKEVVNENQVCPRDSALCDFRILNCSFFEDTIVGNFNFDTVDASGNPINLVAGNSLALPTGFTLVNNSPGLPGRALRAFGTRLSIPFSELGIEYRSSTRLRVEADIVMAQPTNPGGSMIFSFHLYDIWVPGGQTSATLNTGNGWERRVSPPLATNTRRRLAVEFNFNNIDRSRVWIDGVEVSYARVNPSSRIDATRVGDNLNIGSWGWDNLYPAQFYLDNLVITRLAGTIEHSIDCYKIVATHPSGLNVHVHSEACLNGGVEWFVGGVNSGQITEQQARDILGPAHALMIDFLEPTIHTWSNWSISQMHGFAPIHQVALSTSGGMLVQTSTGNDPQFNVQTDMDSRAVSRIEVVLDNRTASTVAQLFWKRTGVTGYYSEARSLRIANMLPNTDNQTIAFIVDNLSEWRDRITSLRFDLGETTGTINIRSIRIRGNGLLRSPGIAGGVTWQSSTIGSHSVSLNPGTYLLETWGAQGGGGTILTQGSRGGRGGYARGNIVVNNTETINVFIGGEGTISTASLNTGGGWNGGGHGAIWGSAIWGFGGGGATDIRRGGSALANRILVAGGGGGADDAGAAAGVIGGGNDGTGGEGGGLIGGEAFIDGIRTTNTAGTQTSGNALGQGGSATTVTDTGGGGGGFWGGRPTNHFNGGGGGGSSFIGGVTNGVTFSGIQEMPNPAGGNMTGNIGSGRAIISAVQSGVVIDYTATGSVSMSTNPFTQTLWNSMAYAWQQNPVHVGTIQQHHVGQTLIITTINGNSENNTSWVPMPSSGFAQVGGAANGRVWYRRAIRQSDVGINISISGGDHWGYVAFFIPNGWDLSNVLITSGTTITHTTSTDTVIMTNSVNISNQNGYTEWMRTCGSSILLNRTFTAGTSFPVPQSGMWHSTNNVPHAIFTRTPAHAGFAVEGTIVNMDFVQSEQTITLPPGRYLLETWGAQGGGGTILTQGSRGGRGGYARGEIVVTNTETFTVRVGGAGIEATANLNTGGGWNGGGHGANAAPWLAGVGGFGGGGATDIRRGGSALANRILVAGGGGGADDAGAGAGVIGGGNDGTGGEGGGLTGGEAFIDGIRTTNTAGTQTSGNALGQGGSATTVTDTAGGGGGFWGGRPTNHFNGGGGGGSSFIGGVTNGVTFSGIQEMPNPSGGNMTGRIGNGFVRITVLSNRTLLRVEDVRPHWQLIPDRLPDGTLNPIWHCGRIPNIHVCDEYCGYESILICNEPHHIGLHYDPGSVSGDICWDYCGYDLNYRSFRDTVQTATGVFTPGNFINIDYNFTLYFPNRGNFFEGEMYGLGGLISQRGLGFTSNLDTTRWTRLKRVRLDFNVIFRNNLYVAGQWITLGDRGVYQGAPGSRYNSTNWSNYGTDLFDGIYQEYYEFICVLANNEAKSAEITVEVEAINCPGPNDNLFETTNRRRGSFTALHGGTNRTYVDVVGRIGNLTIQDTGDYRFSNFFKMPLVETGDGPETVHSAQNKRLVEVGNTLNMGTFIRTRALGAGVSAIDILVEQGEYRIDINGANLTNGGLAIINESGDNWSSENYINNIGSTILESSYQLNVPVNSRISISWIANSAEEMDITSITIARQGITPGWMVDGLVRDVDFSIQNHFLTWYRDIRGELVSAATNFIDTYGTINKGGTRMALPLSAERNNIAVMRDDPLAIGYPIFFDISTIGNYFLNDSSELQIVPFYYALNINTRQITPVDVHFNHNNMFHPINIHNLVTPAWDGGGIYNFRVALNWVEEQVRRNYSDIEKHATENVLRDIYADGDLIGEVIDPVTGETLTQGHFSRRLLVPSGNNYVIGNSQMKRLSGRARTFIGSELTYNQLRNLGGSNTIATDIRGLRHNPSGNIDNFEWWKSAQRWHVTLQLPSSSVFVRAGQPVNSENIEEFANEDYVILATIDTRVIGDTYILQYEHDTFNGTINLLREDGTSTGNITLPNNIPPVLAVFSTTRRTAFDVDVIGTH